jgi:hypothetical protein
VAAVDDRSDAALRDLLDQGRERRPGILHADGPQG